MHNIITNNDLTAVNIALADASPEDIIRWADGLGKCIMTTTFGHHSAVILHMVTRIIPDIHIIWVDTGYNSSATYRFADKLMREQDLIVDVYVPQMTSARRNVLMKGIPQVGDPLHEEFTNQVKLEPFQRAFDETKPQAWITGLRREQTEYRRNMDIVTRIKSNCLKIAPIMNWTETDMEYYLKANTLPNETDYYDPTKVKEARECGLHTRF